jgi:hypothetical protein
MTPLTACTLVLAVLTLLALPATPADARTALALGLGWAACVPLLAACVYGARAAPSGTGYALHRDLGWACVALSVAHGVLFLPEPGFLRYLLPGAPSWQWAGLAALPVLVLLSASAHRGLRRRAFPGGEGFRSAHLVWTTLALALVAWHCVGSAFVLHTRFHVGVFLALLLGAPLLAVLFRGHLRLTAATAPGYASAAGATVLLLLLYLLPRSLR